MKFGEPHQGVLYLLSAVVEGKEVYGEYFNSTAELAQEGLEIAEIEVQEALHWNEIIKEMEQE